jgi:hypothetical protein
MSLSMESIMGALLHTKPVCQELRVCFPIQMNLYFIDESQTADLQPLSRPCAFSKYFIMQQAYTRWFKYDQDKL